MSDLALVKPVSQVDASVLSKAGGEEVLVMMCGITVHLNWETQLIQNRTRQWATKQASSIA